MLQNKLNRHPLALVGSCATLGVAAYPDQATMRGWQAEPAANALSIHPLSYRQTNRHSDIRLQKGGEERRRPGRPFRPDQHLQH
jgi:hypothetical protein